jgi:hypothetical protein
MLSINDLHDGFDDHLVIGFGGVSFPNGHVRYILQTGHVL